MPTPSNRDQVLAAGVLLVLGQLAFRAWALLPSWFYQDDYRFLVDATGTALTLDYLRAPFDSQLMPLGRAIAWLVAGAGQLSWTTAALSTLMLQLLAGLACLWMLTSLFGVRWAVLGPLGLYLCGAVTMPALMWWSAALNQLPLQVVLFVAVGAWVRHLRDEGRRWLALTLAALVVGLLAYVKTVLVLLVLAYLLLGYFTEGGPVRRTWSAVRRFWPAAVLATALGAGYTAYYVTQVPSVLEETGRPVAGELAEAMLLVSLPTGLLGGPWQWEVRVPPVAQADPPAWAVLLTWVALAVGVAVLALLRRRTGRAWLLLLGHAGLAYLVVLGSRAPIVGGQIGLEYRYLTDVAALAPLCLALATLRLPGAPQGSELRDPPRLPFSPGPRLLAVLTGLVCVSGLLSARTYADVWHHRNPGEDYVRTARAELAARGTVDLADQVVPGDVLTGFAEGYNTTRRLVPLLDDDVRFPEVSSRLMAFDDEGRLGPVDLEPAAVASSAPDERCGWSVGGAVTIPLDARTFDYAWWVQIDYLAGADTEMPARLGTTERVLPVRRGLHSLWVRADGELSSVTLGGLADDTMVCVQEVTVGLLEPPEAPDGEAEDR